MTKRKVAAGTVPNFGETRPMTQDDRDMAAARAPHVPTTKELRQTERSRMTYSEMSKYFFPDPGRTK